MSKEAIVETTGQQTDTAARRPKLLVAVAHPDDEAFGCGSVLAHATSAGMHSVVVCATRGELGEVTGDVVASVTGPDGAVDPARLGAVREAELRKAATMLGAGRIEVLSWLDSGVDGDPAPGTLAAADATEVEAALARIIEEERPDVVVTLDAADGHRDHAVVRDATLAAVARTSWRPASTYLWCLPRSLLSEFTGDPTSGTPDEEVTTIVDVDAHLELRWRAMRAHASQTPPYDLMAPELQARFLATDHLQRIEPPWSGGPREADWRPQQP